MIDKVAQDKGGQVVQPGAVLAVAEPVLDAGAAPEPGFQGNDVRAVVGRDEGGR